MKIKAMAKINLSLDVLRKREDGYHELRMIMQTINLYDELTIEKTEKKEIKIVCDQKWLPCDEHNLIYKAAKLLYDAYDIDMGVSINLKKNIPVAAGMAGGSSDAAATLVGMNALFGLGLTTENLQKIGVKIGADVPYCIEGGTVLSEGIGEVLTPLEKSPNCYVVVAKPGISVSTKYVYENLHANTLKYHPDVDGMIQAIENEDINAVADKMGNVLETVTVQKYPMLEEMKKSLIKNGALGALMSGSGPTVFGLFTDEKTAQNAFEQLKKSGMVKQGCVTTMTEKNCVMD